MRKYARTLVISIPMSVLAIGAYAWGTASAWQVCMLAATVIVAQSGSDAWRDKYLKTRGRRP